MLAKEYFGSCDTEEVIRSIEELQCEEHHSELVKKAVSIRLDEHPRERELISRPLTCLHPTPLSDGDMEEGFNTLLDSLDDLTTDVPDARVSINGLRYFKAMLNDTLYALTSNIFYRLR